MIPPSSGLSGGVRRSASIDSRDPSLEILDSAGSGVTASRVFSWTSSRPSRGSEVMAGTHCWLTPPGVSVRSILVDWARHIKLGK
jgi:hypothetical protein